MAYVFNPPISDDGEVRFSLRSFLSCRLGVRAGVKLESASCRPQRLARDQRLTRSLLSWPDSGIVTFRCDR